MNKKAIVIDGNSLMYRSFYATYKQLEYYKKNNIQPVNALKLMTLIILKLITEKYDYALVAFDHGKKTFRNDKYEEYKAGRKPMPDDLVGQIPLIKEMLIKLGFNVMSLEGIEADDLIGSFCKKMNSLNVHVSVFSSDKDLLQLVNKLTTVNLFQIGVKDLKVYNLANFKDNFYQLEPKQIPEFKAIAGDSSDNLKGVKGIGIKTAINLLIKYGSIENIYRNMHEISQSIATKFNQYREQCFMCKELATLQKNIFDNTDEKIFLKKLVSFDDFVKLIQKYHFKGFEKYLSKEILIY